MTSTRRVARRWLRAVSEKAGIDALKQVFSPRIFHIEFDDSTTEWKEDEDGEEYPVYTIEGTITHKKVGALDGMDSPGVSGQRRVDCADWTGAMVKLTPGEWSNQWKVWFSTLGGSKAFQAQTFDLPDDKAALDSALKTMLREDLAAIKKEYPDLKVPRA